MKKILEILKKVKLRNIILLIVLLSFNSYAWFIYANNVSGRISAHVASWDVEFRAGEEKITTNILFDVERVYPGMDTYSKTVIVHNKGDMEAVLEYDIKSIYLLGATYTPDGTTTSDDLKNMLQNNFPFSVNVDIDNSSLDSEDGQCQFTISFEWPYESGDDRVDTYWGERAYEFYSTNPNKESIEIELEISAIQQ